MARFQEKLEKKPEIKKYTIQDYRNLKKGIELSAAKDTGKLGFDPSNEQYKQKVNIVKYFRSLSILFKVIL